MANSTDVKEVINSLDVVNNEINQLLSLEENIDKLISNRKIARDAGNHTVFAKLDEELLNSLATIDQLERQIVAKLNKDIDFDKMDEQRRLTFMLEENSDKSLENEMLKLKAESSFEEFIALKNEKEKDINKLNKQVEELENKLLKLENQPIPDALAIGRTKREIEEIKKKIEKLQKEVYKMISISNIQNADDIEKFVQRNNRIINNNFKNMKLKGIEPQNYAVATDLLRQLNDSEKMKEQYGNASLLESQYEPFKNVLSFEEFSYLSKLYEKQKGYPLKAKVNEKTFGLKALLYKIFRRKEMKDMVIARYPHLAKSENKAQLNELLKGDKGNGLVYLMETGITKGMMDDLHKDIELNIRYYQKNKGKRDWLNSLRINNEQEPEKENNTRDEKEEATVEKQKDGVQSEAYRYLQECGLSEEKINGLFDILNREQSKETVDKQDNKEISDDEVKNLFGLLDRHEQRIKLKKDKEISNDETKELFELLDRNEKRIKLKNGREISDDEVQELFGLLDRNEKRIKLKNGKEISDDEVQALFELLDKNDMKMSKEEMKEISSDNTHKTIQTNLDSFQNDAEIENQQTESKVEVTEIDKSEINDMPIDVIGNKKQAEKFMKEYNVKTIREAVELWNNNPESRKGFSTDAFNKVRKYANQIGAKYTFSMSKSKLEAVKRKPEQKQITENEVEETLNDIEFDDKYVVIRTSVESNGKKRTLNKTKIDYTNDTANNKHAKIEGTLGTKNQKNEEQDFDRD